jgi:hypothetical protein
LIAIGNRSTAGTRTFLRLKFCGTIAAQDRTKIPHSRLSAARKGG